MESRKENSGRQEQNSAVVVGAYSTIGIELIPLLAQKYSNIVLTESGNNYELLIQKVEEWKEKQKEVLFECINIDVLNAKDLTKLSKALETKKVTSFVYLAGVNILKPAIEMGESDWDLIMDINLDQ